jgi:hypothetical protein
MQPFTLTQAIKESKKAKSTLIDAIKNGRLSASRDDKGRYLIDPAELFRVYPPHDGRTDEKTDSAQKSARPTYDVLEYKIESLEQQLQREKELNRELARRLDDESLERRKLTALLTHEKPQTSNGGELWLKVFKTKIYCEK